MDIQKRENESQYEYIKRIVYGKLVDKTINEDYELLSELIFGEGNNYNSSEVRKRFYGIKKILEIIEEEKVNGISDDKILKEYELKRQEIEKERKKIQATKIEYNRNQRVDSRFELLYENIKEAIETLEIPKFNYLDNNKENKKAYVLQFSDVHYGALFKSENNEYSREICKQRFETLLHKTVKLIEKEGIDKLNIINNSDSLQGLLRISDVRMNDIPIVEATIEFSKLMASWLNELSKYVDITYYHVSSANHTELRLLNSSAGQMANEDLERIIVNYIHDMLVNNPRVEVPITTNKPYVNFNLCGYDFIGIHGHQIRSIENSLKDYSLLHKKFYSFVLLGHFHNSKEVSVGEGSTGNAEVLVSPSIVGSCPYADSLFVGGRSMAKLHTFAENEGRIQTNNILLN